MGTSETLIDAIIDEFKKNNNLENKFLFDVFSVSQILKNKLIGIEDIYSSIVDNGMDGGIDLIILIVDDKFISSIEEINDLIINKQINKGTELEIYFIQVKDSLSFKESVFEKMLGTFYDYFNNDISEKKYNKDLISKFEMVKKSLDIFPIYTNKIKINVLYISKGDDDNISDGVNSKLISLNNFLNDKIPTNVNINIYGRNKLRDFFLKHEENEFILKYENDINSIFSGDDKKVAYIVQAKLKDLFEFIKGVDGKINENMLENNVRHWQGNVEVNNNIYNTLKNDLDIEFLWLNNGITIINDEVTPLPGKKLKLVNSQIVNGLQTSYSIFDFFSENPTLLDNEQRSVLIKLIRSDDPIVIDKIIKSTNSQTAIRPADLKATDGLQRDIEKYFSSKGYFYDRRKNYYKNLDKDRAKIFDIPKLAQYVETILFKNPGSARANPTSLVKDENNYKKIFNSDIPLEVYLNSCIINKFVSSSILNIDSDLISENYGVSIRNFTFHLMLIVTMIKLGKDNYTLNDIKNITGEDDFLNNDFNKSLNILLKVLNDYDNDRKIDNIVHTAKSKDFSDYLKENVLNYL